MEEYYFEPTRRVFMSNRRVDNGYSHNFHFHDGYEIYILNKGTLTFRFETFSFKMKHGSLVVIPANVPHSSICTGGELYDRIVISMREEYIKSLCTESTDLMECFRKQTDCSLYTATLSEEQLTEFIKLQQKLDDLSQNNLFGNDVLYKAHIMELMVLVNRVIKYNDMTADNIMPEMIHRVLSYIVRCPMEEFSLEQLSEELHMSGTYLSRKFKEYMGISIRQYIVQKKVTGACSLLQSGENVTNACYNSGFNDYANFMRTFKKVTGMTPGEYAKKNRHI